MHKSPPPEVEFNLTPFALPTPEEWLALASKDPSKPLDLDKIAHITRDQLKYPPVFFSAPPPIVLNQASLSSTRLRLDVSPSLLQDLRKCPDFDKEDFKKIFQTVRRSTDSPLPEVGGIDVMDTIDVFRFGSLVPLKLLWLDGSLLDQRGADGTLEAAILFYTATRLLDSLPSSFLTVGDVARRIQFNLSLAPSFLSEVSRVRAFRYLWGRILSSYGVELTWNPIHTQTALSYFVQFDVYTNLLRTGLSAFTAIVSNAATVALPGFTAASSTTSTWESLRLANSIFHVYQREAHLDITLDPLNGSDLVEELSRQWVDQIWKEFLHLDDIKAVDPWGGLSGWESELNLSAAKRLQRINNRKDLMVGVTYSQNLSDPVPSFQSGYFRCASKIEELRIKLASHPVPPKILLVPLGDAKRSRLRVEFLRHFLGAGGFTIDEAPFHNDLAAFTTGATSFLAANYSHWILCSSDDLYADLIKQWAATRSHLGNQKPPALGIAGLPANQTELRQLGAEFFVHQKQLLTETLELFLTGSNHVS